VFRKANQRFIPESPYHNPDVKQAGDDPATAVALAAEYCAERGTEINPVTGSETCSDGKINIEYQWAGPSVIGSRIADLLDQGWSEAFNVTYDELLQDEHINQTAFGQYNVTGWRQFGGGDPTFDNVWTLCRTIGPIALNWPRHCNEERDALLLAAQVETDPDARAELYRQAEQMFHDDYTYVFYHHTMWDIAVTEDVRNLCGRMSPEGDLLACTADGRTWFSSAWMD
jgi:ABC-type transport system substrate-binding protein